MEKLYPEAEARPTSKQVNRGVPQQRQHSEGDGKIINLKTQTVE